MTISYCTKCVKESCQHGGWTSRSDEVLMRQALEVLEALDPGDIDCDCPQCAEIRVVIAALNERLL